MKSLARAGRISHSIGLAMADGVASMVREGRWKLLPAFVVFLALAALLALIKAVAPLAPFVYSLF